MNTSRLCYYFLSTLLFSAFCVHSQVITVVPAMPTDQDAVLVTFDATQGDGSLATYTGDVYAHTGVKIEGNSEWTHVVGNWGNNDLQPKLTSIGNHKYTLSLAPSIREFYNVPANEKIVQLCFVFRAAAGSPQSEDIFYNVYELGMSVNISNPVPENPVFELNDSIDIQVTTNNATSLLLIIDSDTVYSTDTSSIHFPWFAGPYGTHWIKAVASDGIFSAADSVYVFVRPGATVEDLPAGLIPGVNRVDDHAVTLVLNDPAAHKEFAFVVGSFNQWLIGEEGYMKRTPDGKNYWITLSGLDPNTEYIYQYQISGGIKIADPYTEKISDPWNDQYISATNYPNLIAYPTGKTSGIASTFKIQPEVYSWEIQDFNPPAKDKLVIYELHVRDFINGDYIKTVMDSLNYLQNLGINAIELMPFSEFEGNDSWGYNPSFYFAPDKAYGTENDYKRFIDECHKRGIAVIMDVVLNHSFRQSPLVLMYYNADLDQPTADNPWYNQTCPHQPWCWGYDFNHSSIYTKDFVDRVLKHWLTNFKVDGFRFDFTKGFSNHVGDGQAYDASRITILKRMADKLWDVNPEAYVIFEHLTDNSEETVLANYGIMLWGNMNYRYNEASMGWVQNSDLSGISYKNRGWDYPSLIGYMESHDEERLMYKNLKWGNANDSYSVKDMNTALSRVELAAAFFFPVPGPKMLWQFGELGYNFSIDTNGRVGRKPIRWDFYNDLHRRRLYQVFSSLIKLKTTYPTFVTTDFTMNVSGACKTIHLNHAQMDVVVLGNFDIVPGTVDPQFQRTGRWYNYFKGDSIEITNVNIPVSLEPGEYRLYTSLRLPRPDILFNDTTPAPAGSKFMKVCSNLTKDSFILKFETPVDQIRVYDINGRMVYLKSEGIGSEVKVDCHQWRPGYFRVQTVAVDGRVESGPVIKY